MFVSPITRRTALGQLGDGFAGMAIGSLIASSGPVAGQDVEDLEPPSDAADVTQPSEQG